MAPAENSKYYNIRDSGKNLELDTPYGKKTLYGDFGFDANDNYRIEIPLSDLKPEDPLYAPAMAAAKKASSAKKENVASAEDKEVAQALEAEPPENENSPDDNLKNSGIFDDKAPTKSPVAKPENRSLASVPPKVIVEYDDSDRLVLEANRLYNRRKFFEATSVIDELLRRNPEYPRAWVMKGSLMHVQGHRDLAQKAWEKAIELDPSNREVKSFLQAYAKSNPVKQAANGAIKTQDKTP